ncbi:hypothetical protein [Malacoplasma iowae]|uniref:Uncharacterized protein n=1 Tax=Malacoplasma iowae 695 TaxID=1048830 RepID=A0A6P1LCX2_MALIO|nr:hypothetical protein [Malacoplasma iowae]VEU61600.1 Uncharacterised protein [Mycoplasmopsis fermentans]EGZ31696.1 hypothetical protein GUU_00847 [Malacoplasma iowae 695]QHG89309.1 hypothetical protein EER00_00095 [Malacoplasma iowae 695]WPL35993.1 hypothetical protein QX180_01035 [Malacoplasma iowae]WPL38703.1 hypothetical protein QX181_04000 [Malacoplasma iowae]
MKKNKIVKFALMSGLLGVGAVVPITLTSCSKPAQTVGADLNTFNVIGLNQYQNNQLVLIISSSVSKLMTKEEKTENQTNQVITKEVVEKNIMDQIKSNAAFTENLKLYMEKVTLTYAGNEIGSYGKKFKSYNVTIDLKAGYTIQFYSDAIASFKVNKNSITSIKTYLSKEEAKTE